MWRVALYSEPALDARSPDLALLTPGEMLRASRFDRALDRDRFVVSHHLLRVALADALGVTPAGLVFDFACERCGEQHGRPRVVGVGGAAARADAGSVSEAGPVAASVAVVGSLSVSLSRAGGAALIAVLVAPAGVAAPAVGVDLERTDAVAFAGFDDVALSAAERAAVLPGDAASRAALWVRKEAVAKALGSGLRTDPRTIEVLELPHLAPPDSTAPDAALPTSQTVVGGRPVAWLDVSPGASGHAAAVAVAGAAAGDITVELRSLSS